MMDGSTVYEFPTNIMEPDGQNPILVQINRDTVTLTDHRLHLNPIPDIQVDLDRFTEHILASSQRR